MVSSALDHHTLDHPTLEAIGVLARAVDQVRVPGVLEFRLLANALRRAVDSRSEQELNEAARVFQSLDPELRVRIVERAKAEAHAVAGRSGAVTLDISPLPAPHPAAKAPSSIGSGFLAALNGLRPSSAKAAGAKASSRGAAKDRLRAAVESQRALPENTLDTGAPDVGYDTGLRPGAPLPRSS